MAVYSRINLTAHIDAFESNRDGWLEMLDKNPNNIQAAEMIVRINAKLELLRLWHTMEMAQQESAE